MSSTENYGKKEPGKATSPMKLGSYGNGVEKNQNFTLANILKGVNSSLKRPTTHFESQDDDNTTVL